ncbi:MAG: hypothetical protein AB7O96_15545 [Pseudobdellovibrionaceae bacterium]
MKAALLSVLFFSATSVFAANQRYCGRINRDTPKFGQISIAHFKESTATYDWYLLSGTDATLHILGYISNQDITCVVGERNGRVIFVKDIIPAK